MARPIAAVRIETMTPPPHLTRILLQGVTWTAKCSPSDWAERLAARCRASATRGAGRHRRVSVLPCACRAWRESTREGRDRQRGACAVSKPEWPGFVMNLPATTSFLAADEACLVPDATGVREAGLNASAGARALTPRARQTYEAKCRAPERGGLLGAALRRVGPMTFVAREGGPRRAGGRRRECRRHRR